LAVTHRQNLKLLRFQQNMTFEGFKPHEILKLKRNLAIMKETIASKVLDANKRQFAQFIEEYDRRRDTKFETVFPEMVEYYDECKSLNNRY